jgi:hypothetical protein
LLQLWCCSFDILWKNPQSKDATWHSVHDNHRTTMHTFLALSGDHHVKRVFHPCSNNGFLSNFAQKPTTQHRCWHAGKSAQMLLLPKERKVPNSI